MSSILYLNEDCWVVKFLHSHSKVFKMPIWKQLGLLFVQMDMAEVVVERFGNVKKCFQSSNRWKFEASLERSKKVFKSPIWKCQKRFMISRFFLIFSTSVFNSQLFRKFVNFQTLQALLIFKYFLCVHVSVCFSFLCFSSVCFSSTLSMYLSLLLCIVCRIFLGKDC